MLSYFVTLILLLLTHFSGIGFGSSPPSLLLASMLPTFARYDAIWSNASLPLIDVALNAAMMDVSAAFSNFSLVLQKYSYSTDFEAMNNFLPLSQRTNLVGVVGVPLSDTAEKVRIQAQYLGIAVLSSGAISPDSISSKFPLISRICWNQQDLSLAVWMLIKKFGWNKFTLIHSGDSNGKGSLDALVSGAQSQGLSIVQIELEDSVAAMAEALRLIHNNDMTGGATVRVLFLPPEMLVKLVMLAASSGNMLIAGEAWIAPTLTSYDAIARISGIGRLLTGFIQVEPILNNGNLKPLNDRFGSSAKESVDIAWAAFTYDSIMLMARACNKIIQQHKLGPSPGFLVPPLLVMNAVMNDGTLGLAGRLYFDGGATSKFDFSVLNWDGKANVRVGTFLSRSNTLSIDTTKMIWPGRATRPPSNTPEVPDTVVWWTKHSPPLVNVAMQTDSGSNAVYRLSGLLVDLRDILEIDLGIKITLQPYFDTWDNMVTNCSQGGSDGILAALTATTARASLVQLSQPYMYSALSMLSKRPTSHISEVIALGFVAAPYDWSLWVLFVVFGVLSSLLFSMFEKGYLITDAVFNWVLPNSALTITNIKSIPGRVFAFAWMFCVVIFTCAYISWLSAFLASYKLEQRYNSLSDLNMGDAGRVAVECGDEIERTLESRYSLQNLQCISDIEEGKQCVRAGVCSAVVAIAEMAQAAGADNCDLLASAESEDLQQLVIAVTMKEKSIISRINAALANYGNDGTMTDLQRKWIDSVTSSCDPFISQTSQIDLASMQSLFIMLSFFLTLALALHFSLPLFIEYLPFKQRIAQSSPCHSHDNCSPRNFFGAANLHEPAWTEPAANHGADDDGGGEDNIVGEMRNERVPLELGMIIGGINPATLIPKQNIAAIISTP